MSSRFDTVFDCKAESLAETAALVAAQEINDSPIVIPGASRPCTPPPAVSQHGGAPLPYTPERQGNIGTNSNPVTPAGRDASPLIARERHPDPKKERRMRRSYIEMMKRFVKLNAQNAVNELQSIGLPDTTDELSGAPAKVPTDKLTGSEKERQQQQDKKHLGVLKDRLHPQQTMVLDTSESDVESDIGSVKYSRGS